MPSFNYYSENGELLKTVFEPLNENNLTRFEKEYGTEQTKGYLLALQDFDKQLFDILEWTNENKTGFLPHTPAYVRKHLKLLYESNAKFLENPLVAALQKPAEITNQKQEP